jgi:hypothetical protein
MFGRLSDDDGAASRFEVPEIERLLSAGSPALAFAAIQALRAQADRYERDLIRSLRWDAKGNVLRTWAEVAELVDAGLGSRQAAHQRWGRLKGRWVQIRLTKPDRLPCIISDSVTASHIPACLGPGREPAWRERSASPGRSRPLPRTR